MINLLESQWWSYTQLRDFQTKAMRHIVQYANDNIRGYRELWKGVDVAGIRELSDLKRLPIVTRAIMQDTAKWVNPLRVCTNMRTGGSTGEPLVYHEDSETEAMRAAIHNRGWLWSQFDQRTDARAVVCSQRGGVGRGPLVLNIPGSMDEKDIRGVVEQIMVFKPKQLRAYVSTAYILACWIISNDYKITIPSINLIAEQLERETRGVIEEAFNGEVFEEYCCCDGGASAWDCELGEGMHETMERAYLEHDPDGAMLVTDLWNEAMPFIRYVNGDRFEREGGCDCGRKHPIITVQGRANDIITLPGGDLSPSYLLHHVSHVKCQGKPLDFKAIQYVQTTAGNMVVRVVAGPTWNNEQWAMLINTVQEICKGLSVEVKLVDALEKTRAGKLKFVINESTQ